MKVVEYLTYLQATERVGRVARLLYPYAVREAARIVGGVEVYAARETYRGDELHTGPGVLVGRPAVLWVVDHGTSVANRLYLLGDT